MRNLFLTLAVMSILFTVAFSAAATTIEPSLSLATTEGIDVVKQTEGTGGNGDGNSKSSAGNNGNGGAVLSNHTTGAPSNATSGAPSSKFPISKSLVFGVVAFRVFLYVISD